MRRATGMSASRGRSTLAGVLLATSVAGRRHPRTVPTGVVNAGSRTEKRIALTFDACATRAPSKVDRGVIDVLVETQTRATFFLGGKWMTDHPSETRLLASLSQFELGNHSYLHPHMPMLDGTRHRQGAAQDPGDPALAHGPRPPDGSGLPTGNGLRPLWRPPPCWALRTVMYDLASGDPDSQATSDRLIEYVVRKARNGSIVVMHANGRGWHTAEALPRDHLPSAGKRVRARHHRRIAGEHKVRGARKPRHRTPALKSREDITHGHTNEDTHAH